MTKSMKFRLTSARFHRVVLQVAVVGMAALITGGGAPHSTHALTQSPHLNHQLAPAVAVTAGSAVSAGSGGSATANLAQSRTLRTGEVFRDRFADGSGQGPEMVVLPSGSFTMGSPSSEAGRNAEREGPQRTVRIGYRLAVARYEVTFSEWDACLAGRGCVYHSPDGPWGRGTFPVVNVAWYDAQAYVTWLNRRTGLTGRVDRYRLLSEAEWEYAARAGSTTAYSFGNDAGQLGAHARFWDNSNSRAYSVGGKRPNGFGLYDMHGNVWELVEDCWNDTYANAPSDGSPSTIGDCSHRVIRGGSWINYARDLRSAVRFRSSPSHRVHTVGFRLARTLPE
jgi:formylglycine-generating enzyme required for sulfatase activity